MKMLRYRWFGFAAAVLFAAMPAPRAAASDAFGASLVATAPLEIPHSLNLELDWKARRHARGPDNIERSQWFTSTSGLEPLVWPRNGDVRARLVTPGLRRTPVVGWIASNLYRSSKETGWCLEVDPGEGEYLVFYRLNLR